MILFPGSKINLGLHILRKRNDGYHDLETVFYPLSLCDILEVVEMQHWQKSSTLPFNMSGMQVEGNPASNLCVKAYRILKKDFPELPHVRIHLHKNIPTGAGLGGGSADAACMLLLLNKKFNLGISESRLLQYSLELGSDCPFFIKNVPCYGTGRGEQLEEVKLDLSAYRFVIVNPGIHVNTSNAFMNVTPTPRAVSLKELIREPVGKWQELLTNDFEKPIFKKHPEIAGIKEKMYKAGAIYASMTGSGSTVFGIFEKQARPVMDIPPNYFYRELISQR